MSYRIFIFHHIGGNRLPYLCHGMTIINLVVFCIKKVSVEQLALKSQMSDHP